MTMDIGNIRQESLFGNLTNRNIFSDFLDLIDDVCTPDKENNSIKTQCRQNEQLSIPPPFRPFINSPSASPLYTPRKLLFGARTIRHDKRPSDNNASPALKRPSDNDASPALKRLANCDYEESPSTKRLRTNLEQCCIQNTSRERDDTSCRVEEHLTSSQHLVANGSRDYRLPTIPGKHGDLKSISVDTMSDVVSGIYSNQIGEVTVIDCRYPYEFAGGHIRGAVNLYTRDDVIALLKESVASDSDRVLIFHCEFSSERGPNMSRFLRENDRAVHQDSYPQLTYPEIYLLHGGYKSFFSQYPDLCTPTSYMPMLHKDHTSDLRHFRIKSKSWSAGDNQRTTKRSKSRISLEV